jgi:hypothetical protein
MAGRRQAARKTSPVTRAVGKLRARPGLATTPALAAPDRTNADYTLRHEMGCMDFDFTVFFMTESGVVDPVRFQAQRVATSGSSERCP